MSTAAPSATAPGFVLPPVGERPRSLVALLGDSLRRPGGRRGLSLLTVVLFLSGVSLFAYPVVTDVLARQRQQHLVQQFDNPSFQLAYRTHHVKVGEGLTRLVIPRMHLDVLVVEGTSLAALEAGAGHYTETPLPGQRGNVGIAGHRTTYGRPFNQLDIMRPGDLAYLYTPFAKYTYQVVKPFGGHANPWVVQPDAFYVVSQAGVLGSGHWLTLTTCNPKGSAAQRLVLRLTLVKSAPLTAGKARA